MILKMEDEHPVSEPHPYPCDLSWTSVDGTVTAALCIHSPTKCTIKVIEANPKKQGHGRCALKELRSKYSFIRAVTIGDGNKSNRPFWLKMRDEGLVDELLDYNGCVVPPKCS